MLWRRTYECRQEDVVKTDTDKLTLSKNNSWNLQIFHTKIVWASLACAQCETTKLANSNFERLIQESEIWKLPKICTEICYGGELTSAGKKML